MPPTTDPRELAEIRRESGQALRRSATLSKQIAVAVGCSEQFISQVTGGQKSSPISGVALYLRRLARSPYTDPMPILAFLEDQVDEELDGHDPETLEEMLRSALLEETEAQGVADMAQMGYADSQDLDKLDAALRAHEVRIRRIRAISRALRRKQDQLVRVH